MLYFDTHTHYDWKEFDEDREELFEKFQKNLEGIVNIGINIESTKKCMQYSEKYPFMYYSAGIHPMEVEKNFLIDELEDVVKKNIYKTKLVAIGETGLDYHFNYPKELQREYFIKQIKLANKYNLPIIIHSRDSQEDVLEILTNNKVEKTGIMHCYSGTPEMVKKFLELGYYIGVGGPITRYDDVKETVRVTPMNRIVIETDSPVLPPKPYEKHSRNNSLYLELVVKEIAKIKNLSEEEVINITTKNGYKVYGIDK